MTKIVEQILNFNKQQKFKEFLIFAPKKLF